MSMDHKAFVFDSEYYHKAIEPIIIESCNHQKTDLAIDYINTHISDFLCPYHGDPLDADWQETYNSDNLQVCFDILLTACYDPDTDIGLGYSWDALRDILEQMNDDGTSDSWVLGKPLVYSGVTIDPGAMGFGIIEKAEVTKIKETLTMLKEVLLNSELDYDDPLYEIDEEGLFAAYDDLLALYEDAEEQGKGILFTF